MSDEKLLNIYNLISNHLLKYRMDEKVYLRASGGHFTKINNYYLQYSISPDVGHICVSDIENYEIYIRCWHTKIGDKITISHLSNPKSKVKINNKIAENIVISIYRELRLNKLI